MRRVRVAGLNPPRSCPSPPASPSAHRPPLGASHSTQPARGWCPSDPIRFATSPGSPGDAHAPVVAQASDSKGREWRAGDPIAYATWTVALPRQAVAPVRLASEGTAQEKSRSKGEAAKAPPRSSQLPGPTTTLYDFFHPVPPPPSTACATIDAHSPPHSLRTNSSSDSWPLVHRFDPPSPSPSPSLSRGSTARFSPSRSYAQIDLATAGSPARSTMDWSDDGEVEVGSFGAVDEWGAGKVEMGVQAGSPQVWRAKLDNVEERKPAPLPLSQDELRALVEGVDFEDDLSWNEDVEKLHPGPLSRSPFPPPLRTVVPSSRSPLRIHHRPNPPSPLSPHGQADLFSPSTFHSNPSQRPQRLSSSFILSPLRRSPSPSSSRLFSTSAAPPSAAASRLLEDASLDSDIDPIDNDAEVRAYLQATRRNDNAALERALGPRDDAHGIVIASDDSDSDIEILKPKRVFKKLVAKVKAPATVKGLAPARSKAAWFTKPEGLKPPSSSLSTLKAPATKSSAVKLPLSPAPAPSKAPAASKVRREKAPSAWMQKQQEKTSIKAAKDAKLKKELVEFKWDRWGGVKPDLIYTTDEAVVAKTLAGMTGPFGFDLEWEPTRRRGLPQGKTALAQICDVNTILLVHVAMMKGGFSPALRAFIEDPKQIKLGVQIAGAFFLCDGRKLQTDFGHKPAGMLELNNVARLVDAPRWVDRTSYGLIGLQSLTAIYLDRYLPKDAGVRCGAWAGELSTEQRYYGANDVYSSLQIYRFLVDLAPPGVDVLALASNNVSTASSWKPPKAAFGTKAPPRAFPSSASDESEVEMPKARRSSVGGAPSPRQSEAYKLWHLEGLSPDEAARTMSASRAIKPLSVMWNVLGCLEKDPRLEFDDVRLIESLSEVSGETHHHLMQDHGAFVEEVRARVDSRTE